MKNNKPILRFSTSVYRRFILFRLKREGISTLDGIKVTSCSSKVLFTEHQSIFKETAKISCRAYFESGILKPLEKEKIKRKEYVYVFINKEFSVCKIGFSNDPNKRMAQIQTGCPFKITRELMIEGGCEKEKELHNKYKKYRLEGEWFSVKDELKDAIELKKM